MQGADLSPNKILNQSLRRQIACYESSRNHLACGFSEIVELTEIIVTETVRKVAETALFETHEKSPVDF